MPRRGRKAGQDEHPTRMENTRVYQCVKCHQVVEGEPYGQHWLCIRHMVEAMRNSRAGALIAGRKEGDYV